MKVIQQKLCHSVLHSFEKNLIHIKQQRIKTKMQLEQLPACCHGIFFMECHGCSLFCLYQKIISIFFELFCLHCFFGLLTGFGGKLFGVEWCMKQQSFIKWKKDKKLKKNAKNKNLNQMSLRDHENSLQTYLVCLSILDT